MSDLVGNPEDRFSRVEAQIKQCSPIPACVADGVEHANGETWKSRRDPCETCVCEEGIISCQRQETCPVECDHGAVRQGECCSPCTGNCQILYMSSC